MIPRTYESTIRDPGVTQDACATVAEDTDGRTSIPLNLHKGNYARNTNRDPIVTRKPPIVGEETRHLVGNHLWNYGAKYLYAIRPYFLCNLP